MIATRLFPLVRPALLGLLLCIVPLAMHAASVVYEGKEGPGRGKHIVLLAGDEEYRSEEILPQLGKILAVRHGFKCTVLFSTDPATGLIDPNNQTNYTGLEVLPQADMMILLLRFREWPDAQMKYFADFVNSGKPILALRTSTHSFSYSRNKQSPYAKYDWRSKEWAGGFGQQVLGETWINHHGDHAKESTRGVVNQALKDHPALRGVADVWGPSDVYGVIHLPENAQVLLHGQVLAGMKPEDKPLEGKKNTPLMPVYWLREYRGETGKTSRIITTTMGAAIDFQSEDLRRLVVNSCYWALDLSKSIPARSNVGFVGEFTPSYFGFNKYVRGVKPADHALK
jgi:hypothetical protein